jgi:Nickel-dependent hydrogenase/NifU-like domain
VLSHHMVIRDGKIANYHPYPPTPWNGSVRDVYGTPGPYEDAVQNTPIFEENPPENFKGIDIMRAVRSFMPKLGPHAGQVEFRGVDDRGVIQLRLQRGGHGCQSSSAAVQAADDTGRCPNGSTTTRTGR